MGAAYADDAVHNDVDVLAQSSHALESDDVGLAELKRQYGFDPTLTAAPEDDAADALNQKRRRLSAPPSARPPQPPREIYRRKCLERGLTRKRKIEELLGVKQGCLELNLSQFGFHAPQDLQDLLDVVVEAQVPVVLVDVTNNFFDARSFEIFCDLLRLPLLRNHLQTLNLRCMALPQRPDFATLLRILTDVDTGELTQLSTLDLSYNTFFEDAVLSLNDLLNGLKSLQRLSLESCFPKAPDPGVVEVAVVKDLVRTALVSCCDRLQSLNFGSNWMSFPLLNSLFSPESALQELQLAQMTFFYFDASEAAGAPPMSWKFSFQHQQTITLSETRNSRCEYIPFFLDALTYCLKMHMSQLQHLDLWVLPPTQRKSDMLVPEMQLDDRVTGLLLAIADYASLRSLRLRFDLSPRNSPSQRAIATLFQSGLAQCESLELALSAPLSLAELKELLSQLNAPVLRTLKLSVTLLPLEGELQSADFGRVFRAAVASLTELTLDFKLELNKSKKLLPDTVVQEMESAWKSLGEDDTTQSKTKHTNTRKVSLVKRKPRKDGSGADVPRDAMTFAFLFTVGSSK